MSDNKAKMVKYIYKTLFLVLLISIASCIGPDPKPDPAFPPGSAIPVVILSATSTSIAYGTGTTISWTSTNSTSCISPGGGGTGTSGSFDTGALTTTTSYFVTCSGTGGSTRQSITITVGAACSIPGYSPAFWNDTEAIRYNNNCYNYGNNKRTDSYAQPGRYAGVPVTEKLCPNVIASAVADGLIQTTASEVCPSGMDKIAMVVAPGFDFHWYRQGSDGMWSHKPGEGAATNLDGANHPITNPETADRCGDGLCYTQFCAYFCTCSDVQQGQGHATIQ